MAEAVIQIKDESAARAWVATAQRYVDEAERLMRLVGDVLKSIQASSEGNVVEALVRAGESMLSFVDKVAENMKKICATLNSVLDSILEGIGNAIGEIARRIGG